MYNSIVTYAPIVLLKICAPLFAMNMEQFQRAICMKTMNTVHRDIRHFSFADAKPFISSMSEGTVFAVLRHDTTTSPYLFFCLLPFEIQKNVLHEMGLTSFTAQYIFLNMKVAKAFEHYAVCQQRKSSLPIDLYFTLEEKDQVLFLEDITNNKEQFLRNKIPPLPSALRNSVDHTYITSKPIIITWEEPWKNSSIKKRHITTLQKHDALWQQPIIKKLR